MAHLGKILNASLFRLTLLLFQQLEGAFNDSSKHSDVMVSDVTLKQKEETVILSAKLCVVVHATGYFEVKIPKDGKIANITVVEGSVKFTVLG